MNFAGAERCASCSGVVMKPILMIPSVTMGLLGALALAGCANDKPATDASSETTTTSARAPDGLMSSSPNDTNATDQSTAQNGAAQNNGPASHSTSDTQIPQTRAHDSDSHESTWGNGNNGNAAGASQPGVTAPPPPSGGAVLTPIDQGNNPTDLKITQQIRKQVVSDSSLSFTAKNVKIITLNGKVTLRGQVNSDNEKKWIEATADKVVGNANVDSQITGKP